MGGARVGVMEIPIVAVLTACAGLVGFLIARVGYAARLAAATTEAALLRERVDDLEAALAQDQEAAALLAPLRDTLGRVEAQDLGRGRRADDGQSGRVAALLDRARSVG